MDYDSWKTTPPDTYYAPEPDEGVQLLEAAAAHLNDDDEEAIAELECCAEIINREYECQECGAPIKKGHGFCSRDCFQASQI